MIYILICIFVFIIALFLRFYKINKIHINSWDEASYFLESKFMYKFFKFATDPKYRKLFFKPSLTEQESLNKTREEASYLLQELHSQMTIDPLLYTKPGNNIFATLCYELFGINEFSVILPNAVLGLLSVITVYLIGYHIGGIQTAIIAAGILGVSGAHVYHSRNGLAEVKVAFFFILALFNYLILVENTGILPIHLVNLLMIISGIALNFCGACSALWYQPLVAIIMVSDFIATLTCMRIDSINTLGILSFDLLSRIIIIQLIVLAMLIFWDLPYLVQKLYFPYILDFPTYLERLFQRGGALAGISTLIGMLEKLKTKISDMFSGKKDKKDNINTMFVKVKNVPFKLNHGLYGYYILITEGLFVSLSLIASIIWIPFHYNYASMFLLSIFLLLFMMLTSVSWKPARASIILRPLMAILTGIFLGDICNLLNEWFFYAIISFIIIYGIINNLKYLKMTSPNKEAIDFVMSTGIPKFIPFNYQIASVYVDAKEHIADLFKLKAKDVLALIEKGELKYLITDITAASFYNKLEWYYKLIETEPVFRRDNPCITEPTLFAEVEVLYPPFGDNLQFKLNPSDYEKEIRVYDIEKFFFTAEEINQQGEILFSMNNYDLAERKFRTAIEMKDDFVFAYNNLGVVLVTKNKIDDAFSYFDKALEIDPRNYETLFNYITTSYKLNKLDNIKKPLEIIKSIGIKENDMEVLGKIISFMKL